MPDNRAFTVEAQKGIITAVAEVVMQETELLGKRIRELRRASELTQEQLAERVGMSPKYLSNVERGRENVGLDKLFRIARALEVDTFELFNFQQRGELDLTAIREEIKRVVDAADEDSLKSLLLLMRAEGL